MQYIHMPKLPLVAFDPNAHLEGQTFPPEREQTTATIFIDHTRVLPLYLAARNHAAVNFIPRQEDCEALWDKYHMPEHIRQHSTRVAEFGRALAEQANTKGHTINLALVWAAGLLHDLGKAYCIGHKGNHAQLGAAWAMQETRNGIIAQSVLMHVHWLWEDRLEECLAQDDTFIPLALLYADKRVRHDEFVSLDERFEDLLERYGTTERSRSFIQKSYEQGQRIEQALSHHLGVALHEHTLDSGRLVHRA